MGSLRLGICVGLVWLANLIFLPAKLHAIVEGGVMSAFRDVEPVRRSADTEPLKGGANGRLGG